MRIPIIGITFTAVIVLSMCFTVESRLYICLQLRMAPPEGVTYSQYAHSGF